MTEMTATLNKELQLVSVFVFGTKHSLNPEPKLNIAINNVEIEQVEMPKLLGVTLDCKLSW